MPHYRYPPAAATPPRDRWPWLLLPAAGLLTLLLTPLRGVLLYPLLGVFLYLLYWVVAVFPAVLCIGFIWLVLRLTSAPRRSAARSPRPVPYLVWEPWEIILGVGAVALAVLYYGSVDGWHWLARRWRRWRKGQLVNSPSTSSEYG